MRRTLLVLVFLSWLGCRSTDVDLPDHLAPLMRGLRDDARIVARSLATERWDGAAEAAMRLTQARLVDPAADPVDEQFPAYERAYRAQAADLLDSLRAGRARDAEVSFSRLIDRCDACHARYRPGGLPGR